jgi:hypothetical protein
MDSMDIAALAVTTRQQYTLQQASVAVMKMAMDSSSQNTEGLVQLLSGGESSRQTAMQTGIGINLDIAL